MHMNLSSGLTGKFLGEQKEILTVGNSMSDGTVRQLFNAVECDTPNGS
jgi:hypothetical protein